VIIGKEELKHMIIEGPNENNSKHLIIYLVTGSAAFVLIICFCYLLMSKTSAKSQESEKV